MPTCTSSPVELLIKYTVISRQPTVEHLPDTAISNNARKQTLLLLYAGQNGCTLKKSWKAYVKKKLLRSNVKADIVYKESPS